MTAAALFLLLKKGGVMERLTNKREADAQRKAYENRIRSGYPRNIPEERFLRLAAYEETGLSPAEVSELIKDWSDLCTAVGECGGVARLRELAKADKGGRLVVLPYKVGDTVYWVNGAVITECKVHRIQKNRNGLYICLKSNVSHGAFRADLSIGKTVFLTREEAGKALRAMRKDETKHA